MTEPFPIACYREAIAQIAQSVFETMLNVHIEPAAAGQPPPFGCLTAAVYYAGTWRGALLIECSERQAEGWAARLMPAASPLSTDDARDTLGELANVIAGNLKPILPGGIALSIPSVVQGSDYSVRICGGNLYERIPFTDGEPFRITLVEVCGDK